MMRVLFVCTGNICRSPTAEGVFRRLVEERGLSDAIEVDSAGTHDYHVGEAPDPRAQAAARRRAVDLSVLRARKVEPEDFKRFDYVVAMDRTNHRILERLCPPGAEGRLHLMLDFAPEEAKAHDHEVPDPYYGAGDGFERVLDLVEAASRGLLDRMQGQQKTPGAQGEGAGEG